MAFRKRIEREPAGLGYALAISRVGRNVDLARHVVGHEPEFEHAQVRAPALVDIGEPGGHDIDAGFLETFAFGSAGQFFLTLDTTAGRRPEIVLPLPIVAHKQDLLLVQGKYAR